MCLWKIFIFFYAHVGEQPLIDISNYAHVGKNCNLYAHVGLIFLKQK